MYVCVCLCWLVGGGRRVGGDGGGRVGECRDGVKPQALVCDKSGNARSVRVLCRPQRALMFCYQRLALKGDPGGVLGEGGGVLGVGGITGAVM